MIESDQRRARADNASQSKSWLWIFTRTPQNQNIKSISVKIPSAERIFRSTDKYVQKNSIVKIIWASEHATRARSEQLLSFEVSMWLLNDNIWKSGVVLKLQKRIRPTERLSEGMRAQLNCYRDSLHMTFAWNFWKKHIIRSRQSIRLTTFAS